MLGHYSTMRLAPSLPPQRKVRVVGTPLSARTLSAPASLYTYSGFPHRVATVFASTSNSHDRAFDNQPSQSCHQQRWEQRFRELAEFRAAVGHCQVPARFPENPKLGHWLRTQRMEYAQGTLSPERAARLRSLGVRWGRRQKQRRTSGWRQRFSELKEFHKEHGHTHVPRTMSILADWTNLQRKHWREEKLSERKIRELDSLGFNWDLPIYHVTREERWNERYEVLRAYATKYGHCNVPQRYAENPSLGIWVHTQRRAYASGKLSATRKARMAELGFEWGPTPVTTPPKSATAAKEHAGRAGAADLTPSLMTTSKPKPRRAKLTAAHQEWDIRLQELESYRARHGHCHVPERDVKNPVLARWVMDQRLLYAQRKLSDDHLERLQNVGLNLSGASEREWLFWFRRLEQMVAAHNGACGLHTISAEDEALGRWVQQQRRLKRRRLLPRHREASLHALGVDLLGDGCLESYSEIWEQRYAELEAHATRHGFGLSAMRASLRAWVVAQRKSYKNGTLSDYRIRLLEELKFQWLPAWDTQFSELVRYWLVHGDCLVPQHYDENPQLGTWVRTQRRSHKHGAMRVDRLQKLDALGFSWGTCVAEDEEHWDSHCSQFATFRSEHAADVYPPDGSSLARWLDAQLHEQSMGRLSADRQARLEGLGVAWSGSRCTGLQMYDSHWEEGYEQMARYHRDTGSCEISSSRQIDPQLLLWMYNQIQLRDHGCLQPSRVEKLAALGFPWKIVRRCNSMATEQPASQSPKKPLPSTPSRATARRPSGTSWWDMHNSLSQFQEMHGHCRVPEEFDPRLASWVAKQCTLAREGGLLPERAAALSSLGFSWEAVKPPRTRADAWETRFQELLELQNEAGHWDIPSSNVVLLKWANMQRFLRKRGSLAPDYIQRLDTLGFRWADDGVDQQVSSGAPISIHGNTGALSVGEVSTAVTDADSWEDFFQELAEFRARAGHCRLVGTDEAKLARGELVSWVRLQIFRYEAGTLPESLANRLTSLNLEWGYFSWVERYQELCTYLREHGDCMVTGEGQHHELHRWTEEQRAAMRDGSLPHDMISKLDRLGFFWGG